MLDLIGGGTLAETIDACASRARIVVVGLTAGVRGDLDLRALLFKRLTIVGTVLRSRPLEEKIEAARLLEKNLGPWLAARRVRPVVDKTFPLSKAGEAHVYVAENRTFGKVLLRVDE